MRCDAQQLLQLKLEVMQDVRGSFLEQLRQLIETARQMVSALQRTSKLRSTTGGENVSMYNINSINQREWVWETRPTLSIFIILIQQHLLFN